MACQKDRLHYARLEGRVRMHIKLSLSSLCRPTWTQCIYIIDIKCSPGLFYGVLAEVYHLFEPVTPWASYQIRKIAGCACAGNAGNVSPRRRFQRKPLVSDPAMHHGTCVTHVPWCMSGSLTCGDGENVPGIPGACAPAILRIWQEAHDDVFSVQHSVTESNIE